MSTGSTVFVTGERPRPDWLRRNPRAWLATTATVCFGAFMGQLDASVVALTYHDMGDDFGAGLDAVQWVSLSYLITLSALLIPLGRLSDRLGRKRVYLWGFGLFTVTSVGCALAPSLLVLVLLRAAQGAGAAMLQANSIALVSTCAPSGRLRTALAIQAAAQAIGLAVGPTVGGLIVQGAGWRWVFALNVPVGLVAIVAGRYLLPRTRITPGANPRGGPGEVLRRTGVPRNLVGALIAYLILFGPIVLVPTLLQSSGRAPLTAGLVVATLPVGFALGAVAADRLLPASWTAGRRGRTGVAICLLALVGLLVAQSAVPAVVFVLAVLGVGLGVFIPANNAAIMAAAPAHAAASAGGLVSTARAVGTAAGTAVVALTLTAGNGRLTAVALLAIACVIPIATLRERPAP